MTRTWLKKAEQRAAVDPGEVEQPVRSVIARVRAEGDAALRAYTEQFDRAKITRFRVNAEEIAAARQELTDDVVADIEFGIERIRSFAEAQRRTITDLDYEALPGVFLGHRNLPLNSVGCYVPGGRYPLMSAAPMSVVPAKVAGVPRIVVCTPPGREGRLHPAVLWGAHRAGADEIYRVGGAQAIAALACGTESIARVDKVVGPGNRFVTEAKRQLFGEVGVDLLAGPSEIEVIADETARPEWVAADLLGQAEHDVEAKAVLITTSRRVAEETLLEIDRQLTALTTAAVAGESWCRHGEVVLVASLDEAAILSDEIGPEHVEVHAGDPRAMLAKLRNYGTLYLGEETGAAFSNNGTNSTLPTDGACRYIGGTWVGSFLRSVTHQWVTRAGAESVAPYCIRQSEREGLQGHREAAALRAGGRW
jgi:sulfopropanediol 3-dehydrogenase